MEKPGVPELLPLAKHLRHEEECCDLQECPAVRPALPSHSERLAMVRDKSKRPFSLSYEELLSRLARGGRLSESVARLRREMEKEDFRCI